MNGGSMKLSSMSSEGLTVHTKTEFQPSTAEFFRGRAQLTMDSGVAHVIVFPTAAEMRALAGELLTAAAQVELQPVGA